VLVAPGARGGVVVTGHVALARGVTLCVAPGATLRGSGREADYPADENKWALLYGFGADGAGVGGGGVVDGNFIEWAQGFNAAEDQFVAVGWPNCTGECRPRLARIENTVGFTVDSVTFTGSSDWTFHLLNCSHVLVTNWTQHGDERWPNNDGIDIDSSSHVLVEKSSIDTADDGVCIKGSTPGGAVFNVTVRDSVVRSRSTAVKFGSNCGIPMSELLFENLTIVDSNRGLGLQARDGPCAGGFCIQNVTFRDILINGTRFWPTKWWGDGGALYINTMLRTPGDGASGVRNITFENIVAFSQGASTFSGRAPGGAVDGVTLRNVSLTIDRRVTWNYSTTQGVYPCVEYDPSSVPGLAPGALVHTRADLTGHMPAIFVEAVSHLVLDDVRVAFNGARRQPYWGANVCVNASAAGAPVTVRGGSCDLGA
jgi:polygalacturonase